MIKYTEEDYINCEMFTDRDTDIRCRTVKIVKTRKDHPCHGCLGDGIELLIKKGETARFESALIDCEFWGAYYCCMPSLDRWLNIINGCCCSECGHFDYKNTNEDSGKCLNEESDFFNERVHGEAYCKFYDVLESEEDENS